MEKNNTDNLLSTDLCLPSSSTRSATPLISSTLMIPQSWEYLTKSVWAISILSYKLKTQCYHTKGLHKFHMISITNLIWQCSMNDHGITWKENIKQICKTSLSIFHGSKWMILKCRSEITKLWGKCSLRKEFNLVSTVYMYWSTACLFKMPNEMVQQHLSQQRNHVHAIFLWNFGKDDLKFPNIKLSLKSKSSPNFLNAERLRILNLNFIEQEKD